MRDRAGSYTPNRDHTTRMSCDDIAFRGIIGRQVFIEMQMIVEASDVETAHKITEEVEKRLEARFNPVGVLIDIEPPDYKSEKISFYEGNNIKLN